jgi:hypothetical protein
VATPIVGMTTSLDGFVPVRRQPRAPGPILVLTHQPPPVPPRLDDRLEDVGPRTGLRFRVMGQRPPGWGMDGFGPC